MNSLASIFFYYSIQNDIKWRFRENMNHAKFEYFIKTLFLWNKFFSTYNGQVHQAVLTKSANHRNVYLFD